MKEPIAAAIKFQEELGVDTRVLVFHLGGCSIEISILEKRFGKWYLRDFEYLPFAGGFKLDRLIVEECVLELLKQHKVKETEMHVIRRELLTICQRAKEAL